MRTRTVDIAIVGSGIVGLAHAYEAAQRGLSVVLFERNLQAVGASIRNFGLVWPIGQRPGKMLDRALRSRTVWEELSHAAGFWMHKNGSIHLGYHPDELAVLEEFVSRYGHEGYDVEMLKPAEVKSRSALVREEGLLAGLYSSTEATVYSREAIQKIHAYLKEELKVLIQYGQTVHEINMPYVFSSTGDRWQASKVIVCSGADFESLYPEYFRSVGITKCKLQMMKSHAIGSALGPTLCAGLTLRHYDSFKDCPSTVKVSGRYDQTHPEFAENGIHVLLAQNENLELIIGDSHHYGNSPLPFDSEEINRLILKYLDTFTVVDNLQVEEKWHGIYAKVPGKTEIVEEVEPGVLIVNALGGAGMTLSFGLAQEVFDEHIISPRVVNS